SYVSHQTVVGRVKGIKRQIPARIRQRIVECPFVRHTKSATERCLAIAEHIPCKTYPWAKIIVVALSKALRRRKPAGTADIHDLGLWIRAGHAGILDLASP